MDLHRRSILSGALVAVSLPVGVAGRRTDGEWPLVRFDETNAGYAPIEAGPGEGVAHRWTTDLPHAGGSPVVRDSSIFVGTDRGTVHAFDADDGTELWQVDLTDGATVRCSVVDDALYATTGDDGEGIVWTIDPTDGSERRFAAGFAAPLSPITADGSHLVVRSSAAVVALEAADGSEAWRFEFDERLPDRHLEVPPTLDGDRVYVATSDSRVTAIDAVDGSEAWSRGFEWPVDRTLEGLHPPVRGPDELVVANTRQVAALEPVVGELLWERDVVEPRQPFEPAPAPPVVTDEAIVLPAEEVVITLDRDGSDRWEAPFEEPLSGTAVAATDAAVFVANHGDGVYGFDPTDGGRQFRVAFEEGQHVDEITGIAAAGESIYFGQYSLHAVADGDAAVITLGEPPANDVVSFPPIEVIYALGGGAALAVLAGLAALFRRRTAAEESSARTDDRSS